VEGVAQVLETARQRHPGEPELVLYSLLWHEVPDLGFPIDDRWAQTTKELAAWIDSDAAHRERGLDLLDRGWISAWRAAGAPQDPNIDLGELVPTSLSRGARAEALLWLLDRARPGPEVVAEPASVRVDLTEDSRAVVGSVILRTRGQRHAWGDVDLRGAVPGIELVTRTFDGTAAEVSFRVIPAALHRGVPHDLALIIRVRGPREDRMLTIPIRLRVRSSPGAMVRRAFGRGRPAPGHAALLSPANRLGASLLFGAVFGAAMGAFRMALGAVIPGGSMTKGLDWVTYEQVEKVVYSFGVHGGTDADRLGNPWIWFGVAAAILIATLGSIAGIFGALNRVLRGRGR
jgi:hypothetical protein